MADQDKPFWCDFCQEYHATMDCKHPAMVEDYECDNCATAWEETNRLQGIIYEIKTLANEASGLPMEISPKDAIKQISGLVDEA